MSSYIVQQARLILNHINQVDPDSQKISIVTTFEWYNIYHDFGDWNQKNEVPEVRKLLQTILSISKDFYLNINDNKTGQFLFTGSNNGVDFTIYFVPEIPVDILGDYKKFKLSTSFQTDYLDFVRCQDTVCLCVVQPQKVIVYSYKWFNIDQQDIKRKGGNKELGQIFSMLNTKNDVSYCNIVNDYNLLVVNGQNFEECIVQMLPFKNEIQEIQQMDKQENMICCGVESVLQCVLETNYCKILISSALSTHFTTLNKDLQEQYTSIGTNYEFFGEYLLLKCNANLISTGYDEGDRFLKEYRGICCIKKW